MANPPDPSSALHVEMATDDVANEWDDFVRHQTGWTPYHLYAWRRVVSVVHRHDCPYLAARDGSGTLRGVLPLVRLDSPVFGRYLASMPFLNYGGPLGDEAAIRALTDHAVHMADGARTDLLELRSPAELGLDLSVSHRKVTVVLDLPDSGEALLKALKAKVRSQVRRPMKEGVEVRFGPDQLDGFYAVFSRHMRDLGTPVQPRRFFEEALKGLGHTMWLGCAYLDGEAIACGAGFRWDDQFELVWASSLRAHNRIAPNMLLYFRFMERCIEDGATLFDFGRCTPNGGPHRFKKQWGGEDRALWWYQHGPKAGGGTPSPDSGAFSYGPRVWRKLPLSLANALGPRIVRSIP